MSQLGQKLRDLRKERKFTLVQVSEKIGVDVAILSKLERGERQVSKAVVQKLASLYQVEPDPLIVSALNEQLLLKYGHDDLGQRAIIAAEQSLPYKSNQMKRPDFTNKDSMDQILHAVTFLERKLNDIEFQDFLKEEQLQYAVLFQLLAVNGYAKMIGQEDLERCEIPFSFLSSLEDHLRNYMNPQLEKGFKDARKLIALKPRFQEFRQSAK